ncbi:MAG TPA: F0F1 ATP synthase subunit A [Solirubrobacterales bacterium]|jgi:F-type H+-transporting ATPase subunit a|nr:F0F1 ATP synthase subunit A [Solirubrobacterales bacterium]
MSDQATPVTAPADAVEQQAGPESDHGLSTKTKFLIGLGVYLAIAILLLLIFGSDGKNESFQPQNEFKLEEWVGIHIGGVDLSINKAVFYLVLASALTIATMVWIARRMQEKPNRVQTAIEVAYDLTKNTITGGSLEGKMAARWFPFLAALFFWIWFSNIIGFLPLPTNTEHTVSIFGAEIPSFAIYAATANLSIPLVLTLVVWISYHVEGIRAKGLVKYLASWLPPGLEDMNPIGKAFIFVIEAISHFARLISLSVRLFANILAGHLLLLFMGGGLAVLLGIAALGALTFPLAFFFFILEVGLIATLQAFIFSTLTAIYLGGATSASH